MNPTLTASIKIEDIQLGRRYVEVRPSSNGAWNYTVKSITRRLLATGREIVTVTYNSGMELTELAGTEVAVFCDVEGEL